MHLDIANQTISSPLTLALCGGGAEVSRADVASLHRHLFAEVFGYVHIPELENFVQGFFEAGGFEVTHQGLGSVFDFAFAVSQLKGFVAVSVFGKHLGDSAGTRFNDRDRNVLAVVVVLATVLATIVVVLAAIVVVVVVAAVVIVVATAVIAIVLTLSGLAIVGHSELAKGMRCE